MMGRRIVISRALDEAEGMLRELGAKSRGRGLSEIIAPAAAS